MVFLIQWLLASVAFAIWVVPGVQSTPVVRVLQIAVSGVLMAIAFGLLDGSSLNMQVGN